MINLFYMCFDTVSAKTGNIDKIVYIQIYENEIKINLH